MSDHEHDALVERTVAELRRLPDPPEVYRCAYGKIRAYMDSPVAFTPAERLGRIRAIVEAVDQLDLHGEPYELDEDNLAN